MSVYGQGLLGCDVSVDFESRRHGGVCGAGGAGIQAGGGKFLARGNPSKTFESGLMQRVVVIEFDSVDQAVATHDSEAYQAAIKALGNSADRDIRIVEGAS